MTDMQPSTPLIPHSREAEEALLGAVMINPDVYYELAPFLQAEDFYIHRHRFVWQAIVRLHEQRCPVDFLTVSEELQRAGHLEEIGGPAYLTGLLNSTPTSLHAVAYGRLVQENAIRRRMLEAVNQVARLAYQPDAPLETVVDASERAIFSAGERLLEHDLRPIAAILSELYDQVEQRASNGEPVGIPTGFTELDNLLGGLQPSDLLILAGRPGMGKTSMLLSIIREAVKVQDKTVAFFSLEMASQQMAQRMMSQSTGINFQSFQSGQLAAEEWQAFARAISDLSSTRLFMDQTPALTPTQLRAKCRRMQAEYGLDLVVIDYLQLMTAGGRMDQRTQEISFISRQLKLLAREMDVPVLAAAQLSRAVEQRADKRPVLSDLRESGSIEQDADVVMFLYRSEEDEKDGLVDVNIAKHRNGPVGSIQLGFRPAATRFENVSLKRYSSEKRYE